MSTNFSCKQMLRRKKMIDAEKRKKIVKNKDYLQKRKKGCMFLPPFSTTDRKNVQHKNAKTSKTPPF